MRLVKINAQTYVNVDNLLSVNFLPDKLQTLVVFPDRMMVMSDFTFDETIKLLEAGAVS